MSLLFGGMNYEMLSNIPIPNLKPSRLNRTELVGACCPAHVSSCEVKLVRRVIAVNGSLELPFDL